MARQIKWSANAQRERLAILQYWAERNGSTRYSEKLDAMFRRSLRQLTQHPKIGRPTSDPDVRMKSVGEHAIFYAYTANELHVLSVWHAKRDPQERPY